MGRTYTECSPDVADMVARVVQTSHQTLEEVGCTFALLFAHAPVDEDGEPTSPAIVVGGYPALAATRVVNLKDRTKGVADAEIVIDADAWKERGNAERMALLDHELEHLEFTGELDDLHRPKLKLRKHDVHLGWFASVAERHGAQSVEVRQAKQLVDAYGQRLFPFMAHPEPEEDRMRRAAGARAATGDGETERPARTL